MDFFKSRALSGLLGTGIVVIVYLLGKNLFGDKSALFSSSLMTVSMGFVNISHFATVDIASLFWFTSSCLMSVYIFTYKSRKCYILSGLLAGIAAAVKYLGGLALIVLVVAHFLGGKEGRDRNNFILGIVMALVGFLVATAPVTIFSFFEFLDGFITDHFFSINRSLDKPYAFIPLITTDLRNALGVPLYIGAIVGFLYSLKLIKAGEWRNKVILIWAMFLPYYLLIGSQHYLGRLRYVLPIIPFLIILLGKLLHDLLNLKSKSARVISVVSFGMIFIYSLLYTLSSDLQFINDSRSQALAWVLNNVDDGANIEVPTYGPHIPRKRYTVVVQPLSKLWLEKMKKTNSLIKNDKKYILLKAAIQNLNTKIEGNEPNGKLASYKSWYESIIHTYKIEHDEFDDSVKGLENRKPDYVIIDKKQTNKQLYDALRSGKTDYRKVAKFKYYFLPWIDPELEKVNPEIFIYQLNTNNS